MPTTKKPAAKKKPTAKPTAKPPSSRNAQSAPPVGLKEDDLNPREQRVLAHLRKSPAPLTSAEIGKAVFARERPVSRQKSWARNCLRRLVREGFVLQAGGARKDNGARKAGEGKYSAAKRGKARATAVDGVAEPSGSNKGAAQQAAAE